MGWDDDARLGKARQKGIERQLFPQMSPEETIVADALQKQNDMQINMISVKTNLPIAKITALLFDMELKGVVRPMAGGQYHLMG